MLGKTDLDGQLSEIELSDSFLDEQIEDANNEKYKKEKLNKSLGMIVGLAIVVLLMWWWGRRKNGR